MENLERKSVTELGDGTYQGVQSGYVFVYNGEQYNTPFGIRGFGVNMTVTIKNGEVVDYTRNENNYGLPKIKL